MPLFLNSYLQSKLLAPELHAFRRAAAPRLPPSGTTCAAVAEADGNGQ